MKTAPSKRASIGSAMVFSETPEPEAASAKKRVQRNGRVMLPFWVPKVAHKQLRVMAAEDDTTQQELLTAALNRYFELRGKPPIA